MSSLPENTHRDSVQVQVVADWIHDALAEAERIHTQAIRVLDGVLAREKALMVYASDAPLLPDEVWAPAAGFPAYEVSSLGRIRFAAGQRLLHPTPRGSSKDVNRAYLRVNLMCEEAGGGRAKRTTSVHTLVAQTFSGPPPSPQHQCAHRNGQNQDNRAANLQWATPAENTGHQEEHGTRVTGESSNLARLCPNAVFVIRNLYEKHDWNFSRIAKLCDLDPPTVTRIARRQSRAADQPRRPYRP